MTPVYVGKENNQVKFSMEFTAEEFEAAIQKAYLKNRGKIAVAGFRKGKAPRKIIEARYGSGIFFDDAIDSLLNENYPKVLDELKIEPIDRPSIDFAEGEKIEQGKGFKVIVTVAVPPEVELKEYKGLKAERELRKVEADAVDQQLKNLQKRNARMVESAEPVKIDDTVVLDYKGFIGDLQFDGGTAEDQSLVIGSNTFIPGFEPQLIGAVKGESRDVTVTFPQDYHAEDLAGKEAVFHCTIKEIKREELPELDDEFAKDVSEFDTLEELKADIAKKAQERVDQENETAGKNAVLAKLVELNPVDVPEVMINDETDNMLNEFAQQMQYQGLNMDDYCKYLNTTVEDIKKNFAEDAKKRVQTRLLVDAVADAEKIEVSAEELEKEYEDLAKAYGMEKDKVKELIGSTSMLEKDIRSRKAIDLIYGAAKLTEPKKTAKKSTSKKTSKKAEAEPKADAAEAAPEADKEA